MTTRRFPCFTGAAMLSGAAENRFGRKTAGPSLPGGGASEKHSLPPAQSVDELLLLPLVDDTMKGSSPGFPEGEGPAFLPA